VLGLQKPEVGPNDRVVSNASCTTHAAALPLALLHRWYGVVAAEMTTVHCTTGSQVTIDQPHADKRRARAALLSMIPTSTTASLGLDLVLPELAGKLSCLAIRVPTAAVSLVELVARTERPVDAPAVLRQRLRAEAEGPWKGLLGYCDEPLVSVDFKSDSRSSIIDAELCERPGQDLVRLVAWYDNEWGYANRLADLLAAWA
jgi:glyceraldehyde 3-phosphate dehydrogenase